jgi:lysophospholipase L1-like esterase
MARPRHLAAGGILLAVLISGCGGTDHSTTEALAASPSASSSSASPTPTPGTATPELDSIVVLGHSGTTGFDSDPSQPGVDVRENSWATGTNPKVQSIYRRLLATHPALKGHTTSLGVDGSTVDDLAAQVESMMSLDPLPDVVVIQTIDNDIKCDGTDKANVKTFGKTLGDVLTTIDDRDPGAQVFLVSQWASVQTYITAVKDFPSAHSGTTGDGLCDTFTFGGKVRPAGIAALQRLVDAYFATVQQVCNAHPRCWTDDAAMQKMPVRRSDLTDDLSHLSVPGHAVMARYAWAALPAAIKHRS